MNSGATMRYSNFRKDESSVECLFLWAIKMLTQDRLKELLSYDPLSGLFIRLVRLGNNSKLDRSAGIIDTHGYLECSVDSKRYRLHRLAWLYMHGEFPIGDIDHINGIRNDNRIDNLRIASRIKNSQNKKNASSNNKTGLLGVFFHKQNKRYTAQIRINGKNKHLGMFDTPELAHQAYLIAKRQFHEGNTI